MNIIISLNEINKVKYSDMVDDCKIIVDGAMSAEQILQSLKLPPLRLTVNGIMVKKKWYKTPIQDLVDDPFDDHYFIFINPSFVCGWRLTQDNEWEDIIWS